MLSLISFFLIKNLIFSIYLEWIKCTTFGIKVYSDNFLYLNQLLFLLSREGHVNIVQELLSRGANVNAATKVFRYQKDNDYPLINYFVSLSL